MPKGLKVLGPLIVNMILYVNISNFLSENLIYIIAFNVAQWDTWVLICKGKIILSIIMVGVMCLCLNMQEEDILELTNPKCLFSVNFSQLIDHCVIICIHLITLMNKLIPRY